MKAILLSLIALSAVLLPVHGQLLSDATGLVNRLDVQSAGHTFEVKTVSNFDIYNFDFNRDEKLLTLYISSGLENNLGEIIVPSDLLGGNFTLLLNGQEHPVKIKSNDKISFITLNFTGSGNNLVEILATEALSGVAKKPQDETVAIVPAGGPGSDSDGDGDGGGCLIATATYGTELAPQVQRLRELRDTQLLSTDSGTTFVRSFNQFYYSFSPAVSDYERQNPIFREMVKISITPMITVSLSVLDHADIGSEFNALVLGSGLILLNIGMYVGIPASVIIILKRHLKSSSKRHPDSASDKNSHCQYN